MAARQSIRTLMAALVAGLVVWHATQALAWTHDTGDFRETSGSWYTCSGGQDGRAAAASVDDGRFARWYPGWDFRGRFRMDIQVPCSNNGDRGKDVKHHVRRVDGSDYQVVTFTQCGRYGWYNLFGDTNWNGDGDRFSRVYFYAYTDTAYPNCQSGYNAVSAGKGRIYGEKWDYINDWTCLGGYGGTIGDNATGWTESDIYLYPAIYRGLGDVFLYGGKAPGRVQTGDCNCNNKLNWKGNAAGYGNCDNCYSYGFAWMYSPGGAGPKFLIGADDDQRTYVNGTLISSGTNCCNRDNFETGGIGMPAGWSRILFKVRNGGGGFDGTVSLRNGGDRGWNEGSVTRYSSSYGLGYEQDDWYPRIDVANFYGNGNPQPNGDFYGNNTTVTASGTSSVTGPVPLWKTMQYQWGYGTGGNTNIANVSTNPTSTSWSHTQTGVTGHRRFHFFSVSKSKRCSFQNSGSGGGWNFADGGPANYMDVYIDNVAPVDPTFASVTAASTSAMTLQFNLPNDQGVGTSVGSTEAAAEAGATGNNYYRRGDVGVKVYTGTGNTVLRDWGGAGPVSHTGLTPNTQYLYRLQARDNTSGGRGSWNNVTDIVADAYKYTWMEGPTGLTFGEVRPNSIQVNAEGTFTNLTVPNSGVRVINETANNNSGWKATVEDVANGYTSGSLRGNVLYTFRAESRNADSVTNTATQPTAQKYTLAPRPIISADGSTGNVYCDKTPNTVWYGPGTTFTFSNTAGWGPNQHTPTTYKVKKFRYVWNTESSHTFDGDGTDWSSGTIVTNPTPGTEGTSYYLHLQSYNEDGLPTPAGASPLGTLSYGPFRYDDAPTTVSFSNPSRAAANSSATVSYTLTFSEAVTGLETSGIQVIPTGGANAIVESVVTTGNPTTYGSWTGYTRWIVTLSNCTGNGTACIAVKANAVTDRAGNANEASGNSPTFIVDNIRPTVSITHPAGAKDPTNAKTVTYRMTFSEPVTGFGLDDVTLHLEPGKFTSGALRVTSPVGSNYYEIYSVFVGGDEDTDITGTGYLSISIANAAAQDAAGNDTMPNLNPDPTAACSTPGDQCTYYIDQGAFTCSITRSGNTPTNADTVGFYIDFNKQPGSFIQSDIVPTCGGGISCGAGPEDAKLDNFVAVGWVDDMYRYTVDMTNIQGTGNVGIEIPAGAVSDIADNPTAGCGPITYDIDQGAITGTITQTSDNPTNATTVGYEIALNKEPVDFDADDLQLGGTVGGTSLDNFTYVGEIEGEFVFTVDVVDILGSGTVTLALLANKIQDEAGNFNNEIPAVSYVIDHTPPTVDKIERYDPNLETTNAAQVVWKITFKESVASVDVDDFTLVDANNSIVGEQISSVSSSSGKTIYVTASTGTSGNGHLRLEVIVPGATITDQVGNPMQVGFTAGEAYVIDREAPTVQSIVRLDPAGQNTNASAVTWQVTFSRDVNNVEINDFTLYTTGSLAGTSVTSVSASSGKTIDVTANTGTGDGNLRLDVIYPGTTIIDDVGNALTTSFTTGQVYSLNRSNLTCTITQTSPNPNNAHTVGYEIKFGRSVSGFVREDILLTPGSVPGAMLGALTGSGSVYNINVTNIQSSGTVNISVPANVANDVYGNGNAAAQGQAYTIDKEALFCSITRLSADPTNANTVTYKIGFNKDVRSSDFGIDDITLACGGTVDCQPGGSGADLANFAYDGQVENYHYYTVDVVNIAGDGSVSIELAPGVAHDEASNPNAGCGPESYTIDHTGPSCTITRLDPNPYGGSTVRYRIVFSDAVTGFTIGDLTLGGSIEGTQKADFAGSGTTYTVNVVNIVGNGTVSLAVPAGVAHDSLGNPNTNSGDPVEYTIDQEELTVTVEQQTEQDDPTPWLPILFDVVFSKPAIGFAVGDVVFTGTADGINYSIQGSGASYTIQVNGVSVPGTVQPTLPAGVARDAAYNWNTASTSEDNTVTYQPAPTPSVIGWRSVRTHGSRGNLPIALNPSAVVTESRRYGLQWLEVDFDQAVQPADGSLDLTDVSILDAQSNAYQPTTLQLIESGQRLVVQFSPGLLPDMKRYTINLADNFKGTQPPYPVVGGTRACQVRLLCGDTNNDNKVDILDLMAIKNANRDPADATNCSVDISADGEVNVIDLAITNSYYGRTVP